MERKAFTSLTEAAMRVLLGETHMIGKSVIVKGKKGKVVEQVGSDGKTESDEIYKVEFEDGSVEDIPARDMEMQGDISNTKEPSENEAEDIVNEAKKPNTNAHSGIPGMSKKGKGILASMTNSFETGGGPWIDHDNIHNLTHHSVNQTIKMADKHLEDNPHPEASRQLALIKKELGESVEMDEATKTEKKNKKSRDSYLDRELAKILGTKKPKSRPKPKHPAGDHPGLDPDLELESVEMDEATKTEKKTRQVQNRTAAAYAQQKTELEPGEKTAKYNRLADRLDKLRRGNK